MTNERKIYLLDPREFSPETIAVAFAKTSRSPESFIDIARDLNDEKSADFHEKWVVGYGHSSVAEHAVLHLAIENVSRLAVESIESNRLASYTEKSTRYQKWDPGAFYTPVEVIQAKQEKLYADIAGLLFLTYVKALEACKPVVERDNPQKPDETESAWERRIRSKYVDVCRFLLPASALANLGMTANARVLESMIRKMLSHELDEVRAIGVQVKKAAIQEVPTLLKYADSVPYLSGLQDALSGEMRHINQKNTDPGDWCTLVDWQSDGEARVIAASLFRYGSTPFEAILHDINQYSQNQKQHVLDQLFNNLRKFDTPLRELEHITYTFDLRLDQGGYFEVKRHRMMTQTVQPLTCDLGYAIPAMIKTAGIYDDYRRAMDNAAAGYLQLRSRIGPAAAYLVPNGFNRRVLLTMNFREAYAFCALRSAPNAHFSVRRVSRRIAGEIQRIHPLLGKHLQLPDEETWQSVENDHFLQV